MNQLVVKAHSFCRFALLTVVLSRYDSGLDTLVIPAVPSPLCPSQYNGDVVKGYQNRYFGILPQKIFCRNGRPYFSIIQSHPYNNTYLTVILLSHQRDIELIYQ